MIAALSGSNLFTTYAPMRPMHLCGVRYSWLRVTPVHPRNLTPFGFTDCLFWRPIAQGALGLSGGQSPFGPNIEYGLKVARFRPMNALELPEVRTNGQEEKGESATK